MHKLIVFVSLLTAIYAVPCTKDRVVSCMLAFADSNHDSKINSYEIDHFFANNKCAGQQHLSARSKLGAEMSRLSQRMTIDGNLIIMMCDMNRDGVLSAVDYSETSGCGSHADLRQEICNRCERCLKI